MFVPRDGDLHDVDSNWALCNALSLHRAVANPLLAYLRLRSAQRDDIVTLDMVIPLREGPGYV
jgi:hypothetical protein